MTVRYNFFALSIRYLSVLKMSNIKVIMNSFFRASIINNTYASKSVISTEIIVNVEDIDNDISDISVK